MAKHKGLFFFSNEWVQRGFCARIGLSSILACLPFCTEDNTINRISLLILLCRICRHLYCYAIAVSGFPEYSSLFHFPPPPFVLQYRRDFTHFFLVNDGLDQTNHTFSLASPPWTKQILQPSSPLS